MDDPDERRHENDGGPDDSPRPDEKKEAMKVRFKEIYNDCLAELKDPNLAAAEAMKRVQQEMKASAGETPAAARADPPPAAAPEVADPLASTELGKYLLQCLGNPDHVERVLGRRAPAAAKPAPKPAAPSRPAVPPATPFPALPGAGGYPGGTAWLAATFGPQVLTKGGMLPTEQVLSGKVVLVYFSAHWCGPCQRFTPMLATSYSQYKASGKNDLEIVFASSDRDQMSFQGYYGSMPWVALPFQSPLIRALSDKFQVRGIPHLGVFGADGRVMTVNGREDLARTSPPGNLAQCMSRWAPASVAPPETAAALPAPAAPAVPKIDTSRWPAGAAIDDAACAALLEKISGEPWQVQEPFYSTVMTLLRNVLDKPEEQKFRIIKTDNEKIRAKVLDVAGAGKDLLVLAGFMASGLTLQHPKGAEGQLRSVYDKVSSAATAAKEKNLRAERDARIAEEKEKDKARRPTGDGDGGRLTVGRDGGGGGGGKGQGPMRG